MGYQDTLNLPRTTFPMKADLSRREPEILALWDRLGVYRRLVQKSEGRTGFILHDGPPYANGQIHLGHALNKILKDVTVKARWMAGHYAPFIPGWDCHGLPIEHQVLKGLGPNREGLDALEIRRLCREYADRFFRIQRDEFRRLGVIGDWDHPYLTMDPVYEASVLEQFARMVARGQVYKRKKPVLWCPFDETALAEAEVEYHDHRSPSIYVKFPVIDAKGKLPQAAPGELHVAIWTTTPWTLVANQAIALHPDFAYRLVQTPQGTLLLAQELIDPFLKAVNLPEAQVQVLEGVYPGRALEGIHCRHPWLDLSVPIVLGGHVTKVQGTGCVHTAPGHGQEDYEVGLKYGLAVYAPVDDRGRFLTEVPHFAGLFVQAANPRIIELLRRRGLLLQEETITHAYPHCWRCRNPVIFRATEQWFVSMEATGLRERALAEIDRVTWIPPWGRERIRGMIASRPDWCISRQRAWGVPIVALRCAACGATRLDAALVQYVAGIVAREGSDAWFSRPTPELLPPGTRCRACGGDQFEKERDILDVWFESGASHAAVLKTRPDLSWPADLYLEGSDQHRGWFHSTLLASVSTDGRAPYRTVLTHGFVVDGSGKKMSKSAGNVIAPQEVIERYGAEILRLWVAAEDYRDDLRISNEILQQLVEAYRKIRNTCRFLIGNLYDFDPGCQWVELGQLWEVDRWILDRLYHVTGRILKAYEQFEFHTVFHTLTNFCAVDLSALYLDILKDRLYTAQHDSPERRAAQTALYQILTTLCRLMAPILSFTAEEIWQHLPAQARPSDSVLLETFPTPDARYHDPELASRWDRLLAVREEVTKGLERARQERRIRSSLEAEVLLSARGNLKELLTAYQTSLPMIFIVSGVRLEEPQAEPDGWRWSETLPGLGIRINPAPGRKCERCWNYQPSVGQSPAHPTLCHRCVPVVARTRRDDA